MEAMLDRRRMACSLMPGEAQCTSLYKCSIPTAFSKMFPEKVPSLLPGVMTEDSLMLGGLCGQLESNTQKVQKNTIY